MKKVLVLLLCFLVLIAVETAETKPLSYVGGLMVMQENDETGHTLSIDYTFDPHFALGMYSKYEIGGKEFYMRSNQFLSSSMSADNDAGRKKAKTNH